MVSSKQFEPRRTGRGVLIIIFTILFFLTGILNWNGDMGVLAAETSPNPNLLVNPGFETGTTDGWSAYGGSKLSIVDSDTNSGGYALRISNRTQSYSSAVQDVTNVLRSYGPGNYSICAHVKHADPVEGGSCTAQFTFNADGSTPRYPQTGLTPINADDYTRLEAEVTLSWVTLNSALLYINTGGGCTHDLYVDDFSLVNLDEGSPDTELNEPGPENLALYKPVTASSTQSASYSSSYITDGKNASSWTQWASDVSQGPQWVEIDFEGTVIFNRVEMYFHTGREQKGYEVQYLDNGVWKNCFGRVTGNMNDHMSHTFKKITTSKLRIYVEEGTVGQDGENGTENVARIVEAEVYYDKNLALGKSVTASSTQEGYSPSNIVNGNQEPNTWTHWAADVSQGPQWVEIDFGELTEFRRVEFYTKTGYEQMGYEVQYWSGTEWTGCFPKVENNTEDHRSHSFDVVTGNKLRVYMTEGNVQQNGAGDSENVARIVQVEVYNTSGVFIDSTVYPEPVPQSIEYRQEKTAVGAIRWDAWGAIDEDRAPGTQTQRSLSPGIYHHRLPWYAAVTGENSASIPVYTQDIVDQEIRYAKNAGIDYWAFVMYEMDNGQPLNLARDLYLSSEYKNEVKWCALLGASGWSSSNYPWLVEQFQTENYQKVQDNRPLVYVWSNDKTIVEKLRELCEAAGVPQPYIVIMNTNGKTMKLMHGDALSAYTAYSANGSPYSSIAAADLNNWNLWKSYGVQVVPMVTTGWDPRPRIDNPVTWTSYGANQWAQPGTPLEIADNLKAALDWSEEYKSSTCPNVILMYAWNENDEGGWIIPTLGTDGRPDTSRLDAIRSVLNPGGAGMDEKTAVTIDGIEILSKVYDKETPLTIGTPVVKTSGGQEVKDLELVWTYTGTDGTLYESSDAPVNAGNYQLIISIAETDAYYQGSSSPVAFTINKAPVMVGPQMVTISVEDISSGDVSGGNVSGGKAIPNPILHYIGLIGDDTIEPGEAPVYTHNAGNGMTPGEYTYIWINSNVSFLRAENYEINRVTTAPLIIYDSIVPVSKSALNALIGQAEARKQSDYTAASWELFAAALSSAKAVSNNPDVTQTVVDNARITLWSAMNALIKNNTGSSGTDSGNSGSTGGSTGGGSAADNNSYGSSPEASAYWGAVNADLMKRSESGQPYTRNIITGRNILLPDTILNTLQGNNSTLAMHTGAGVTFSISSADIPHNIQGGYINLSVGTGDIKAPAEQVKEKTDGVIADRQIPMVSTKDFGMTVNMHFNLGEDNVGKWANLYFYDEVNGKLSYLGSFRINEDGQAMFGITRGADFLLTVTNDKPREKVVSMGSSAGSYVVRYGDTLSGIASRNRVSVSQILSLNPGIKNSNMIHPGQTIRLR